MFTILCIEDETEIRNLIVEELSDAGFATLEAANGREGIEQIVRHRPDIIICDITMPEMDGMQVLAELQINYPDLCHTPFIFLTALADRENLISGLRGGAADYLTKPIDLDVLLAKIEGLVLQITNSRRVDREF